MTPANKRVEYRTGSVYQRKSDGRWIAVIENVDKYGFTDTGGRKRITVSAKTESQAKAKRRRRINELERGQVDTTRATVKVWSEEYLPLRLRDMRPKGYNALANPLENWVIPTIGHRRLDQLTPRDIRLVHDACRRKGRDPGDVHRALKTLLRAAVAEGHHVAPQVLTVKSPHAGKSDRAAMTVPEGLACLEVASGMPHGIRWVFTLLYGVRLGEALGMTDDALDFTETFSTDGTQTGWGEARIEWQLQQVPYVDRANKALGFRVPDGYESRHLIDSFHLTPPKSDKGFRVAPFLPSIREALLRWLEVRPDNPWGLVWPTAGGMPANEKHDREEWHALQGTAGVGHPSGRPYHIHECRNFAATMLLESGAPEHVVTDLLGHTALATSLKYRTVRREPLLDAMQRVGERVQLR